MSFQSFIQTGGYFDQQYRAKSDCRYSTFKAALNLLHQMDVGVRGKQILETGCQRMREDWGAGCSTRLFLDFIRKTGNAHLWSVDLSPESVAMARQVAAPFTDSTYEITQSDSIAYLKNFTSPVDLLYLDSWDYPYGELLNFYGGQANIAVAEATLSEMTEEEIVEKHRSAILPSQAHCLQEMIAAEPLLHSKSIVLIDDNALPGGGKPRLARQYLIDSGWTCILDYQQTLWIKR